MSHESMTIVRYKQITDFDISHGIVNFLGDDCQNSQ